MKSENQPPGSGPVNHRDFVRGAVASASVLLLFGQRHNPADPVDLGKFQEAGLTAKCSGVARQAVRIAAGLILGKE